MSESLIGGPERRARKRKREEHLDVEAHLAARMAEERAIAPAVHPKAVVRALMESVPVHTSLITDQLTKIRTPRRVYNPRKRKYQRNLSVEHRAQSAVGDAAWKLEHTDALPAKPTRAFLKTVVTNARRDADRKQSLIDHREGTTFRDDVAPNPVTDALAAATEAPAVERSHEALPSEHAGHDPSRGVPVYRGGYRGPHILTTAAALQHQDHMLQTFARQAGIPTPARLNNLLLAAAGRTTREIAARKPGGSHFSTIARWLHEDFARLDVLGHRLRDDEKFRIHRRIT
ncbi:MAG: hypothetical protein WEG40_12820 [Candidatus Rokuibacteriota bacterium]